ncbi:Fic family protein [Curtobacterium sp. MCBD17_026]|uniref:Fic/DOC family protein n=1 Tax=Curtobacterium sp. MCBD17_026 TaxID=2175621 RepID=UPI000DA96B83|nr:Fic family protein [Curtobacterium sp. MCBD17_026]WIB72590.1 Fic family protein [Curtobacterium sp. MCBD17_026]
MTEFDTWDSYMTEPHGYVLKNLYGYGALEGAKLEQREYRETAARQAEILTGRVEIPRTFDADHMKAIHRHLFQNVYEWAGEYRNVNMAKQGKGFARTGDIDTYLKHARRMVGVVDWAAASKQEFAVGAAKVFALVNQAHPFREGNGRTSKVLMTQLAEMSRFSIDYGAVTPERWNQASASATPPITEAVPNWQALVPVFKAMAVERDGPPPREPVGELSATQDASASYPSTAVDALRAARYTAEPEARPAAAHTDQAQQKGYER